jgi:hypothetical protein
MRFGETGTHQDIDLLFVPTDGGGHDDTEMLEDFVRLVADRVVTMFPMLRGDLTSFVDVKSNSLHCAHFYIRTQHFADVMQLPAAANALVEAQFPRQRCLLSLPLPLMQPVPTAELVYLPMASLPELLHRLACISESEPLLDGLKIVPLAYNTAVIQKSRLRLRRLRELTRLGMLHDTPCAWDCNPRNLTEPPVAVCREPCMPDFADVVPHAQQLRLTQVALDDLCAKVSMLEGKLAVAHASQQRLVETNKEKLATLDGKLAVAHASQQRLVETNKEQLSSLLAAANDMSSSFMRLAVDKLATLDGKLAAADASGRRLAEWMTAKYKRSMGTARDAVEGALGRLQRIRREVFLRAHPAPVLTHIWRHTEAIQKLLEAEPPQTDAARRSAYADLYARSTKKMARLKGYPYAILDREEVCDSPTMDTLASFNLFNFMMDLSAKGGPAVAADTRMIAPYSVWGRQPTAMVTLTKYVQGLTATDDTITGCVPFVSAVDDSLNVLLLRNGRKFACNEMLSTSLASQKTVELMMHMLHNVANAIAFPVVTEVSRMEKTLVSVRKLVTEMDTVMNVHMENYAEAPFLDALDALQGVEHDLLIYGVAFAVEEKSEFTWRGASYRSGGGKHKKRKNRKNKRLLPTLL